VSEIVCKRELLEDESETTATVQLKDERVLGHLVGKLCGFCIYVNNMTDRVCFKSDMGLERKNGKRNRKS
jgi:hypothetical protein